MKHLTHKILFTGATLLLLSSLPSTQAATSTSANLTSTATVVTSISLSCGQNLAFGSIVSEASADNVTISTAGVRSGAGYLTQSTATQGRCTVTGSGSATYTITLPASISLSDGATHTLTADTLTSTPSGTGTLTAGSQIINIGGTIHVNPAGVASTVNAYTGTGSVTVAYN